MGEIEKKREVLKEESSGQDGGLGRNVSLPCTTKRRITTNLKTNTNRTARKIKVHESLTTKDLKKKHSARLVRGVETAARWRGLEARWQRTGTGEAVAGGWDFPYTRVDKPGGTTAE